MERRPLQLSWSDGGGAGDGGGAEATDDSVGGGMVEQLLWRELADVSDATALDHQQGAAAAASHLCTELLQTHVAPL